MEKYREVLKRYGFSESPKNIFRKKDVEVHLKINRWIVYNKGAICTNGFGKRCLISIFSRYTEDPKPANYSISRKEVCNEQ